MRRRGTVSTLRAFAATALASFGVAAQDSVPAAQSIDIDGSSMLDSAAAQRLAPVLGRAINDPSAGVRNNALRLLELEKANNYEPAYEILTQVSGEAFGDRDYAARKRWASSR
jgi:hypothetical protein